MLGGDSSAKRLLRLKKNNRSTSSGIVCFVV